MKVRFKREYVVEVNVKALIEAWEADFRFYIDKYLKDPAEKAEEEANPDVTYILDEVFTGYLPIFKLDDGPWECFDDLGLHDDDFIDELFYRCAAIIEKHLKNKNN